MGNDKRQAFIEALVNTSTGYGFAILTQLVMFPVFNIEVNLFEHLALGAVFTVVSIGRNYFVRRLFFLMWLRRQSKFMQDNPIKEGEGNYYDGSR